MDGLLIPLVFATLVAGGPQLEVQGRAGGRSAPESALEGLEDHGGEEEEIEPAALAALDLSLSNRWASGLGLGVTGAVWGYAPEGEISVLRLEPWAGYYGSGDAGWQPTAAARYRAETLPWLNTASSGRAEVLLGGQHLGERRRASVSLQGIDRRYFNSPSLSFRTGALIAEGDLTSHHAPILIGGWASAQVNQSLALSGADGLGWQARVGARGSVPFDRGAVGFAYRFYLAQGGEDESAKRRQFDLFGDYADDADALSVGGFTQHRVQLDGSAAFGPWTTSLLAMARLRAGEGGESTFAVTLHAHGNLVRQLARGWQAGVSLGVSDVRLDGGGGYTDVYGWLGFGRTFDLGAERQEAVGR